MAHAGNGGALIDEHGGTGVPGLFACGECATGMHGANRIGGAMASATQVFGKRAGEAAAEFASNAPQPLRPDPWADIKPSTPRRPGELGELRRRMQKSAVLGGKPGLSELKAWLQERQEHASGSWELQLLSAETIVDDLLQTWEKAGGDPLTVRGGELQKNGKKLNEGLQKSNRP
jgi:L-aspartate oxidase